MFLSYIFCALFALQTASSQALETEGDELFQPVNKANHIFNTVHSSMRQWGSALNHNGLSIFPAVVPQGTLLYHGRNDSESPGGPEWVSFERQHSLQFAALIFSVMPGPVSPGTSDGIKNTQKILQRPGDEDDRRAIYILPGFLHTYTAKHDLHLLYLDGSAAAKTKRGTLDMSDLLLLDDPNLHPEQDFERADRLCEFARTQLHGNVEGFIRTEAGFEIIICDFDRSLELVDLQKLAESDSTDERKRVRWQVFSWARAVAKRYDGIGGSPPRVLLDYEKFITAYAYPFDPFFGNASALPRLAGASKDVMSAMRRDLIQLINDGDAFGGQSRAEHDWRAVADMIVQAWAYPLQELVTDSSLADSSQALQTHLYWQLNPYIDALDRNKTVEIQRCALDPFPPNYFSTSAGEMADASIAGDAVYAVSHTICSTLLNSFWSLQTTLPTHDVDFPPTEEMSSFRHLVDWLSWTEWKKCKNCAWDEFCSIPMFPIGVPGDHEKPTCRSWTTLILSSEYWFND